MTLATIPGIIFAIFITLLSWVGVAYLIYQAYCSPVITPEAKTADAARWLRETPGSLVGTISEINIYPIKSCAQVPLEESQVYPSGLGGDRSLMIITAADNNFLTQREDPRLSLISATYQETSPGAPTQPESTNLVLAVPDGEKHTVKLSTTDAKLERRTATIWEEPVSVVDQGDAAAAFLSKFLDKEVRLVQIAESRSPSKKFAVGFENGLSDGFPFLVITEASLDALNKTIKVVESPYPSSHPEF